MESGPKTSSFTSKREKGQRSKHCFSAHETKNNEPHFPDFHSRPKQLDKTGRTSSSINSSNARVTQLIRQRRQTELYDITFEPGNRSSASPGPSARCYAGCASRSACWLRAVVGGGSLSHVAAWIPCPAAPGTEQRAAVDVTNRD